MMNQEQLNAIKERVAKATPGPWEIDRNSDDSDFITDIWFNQDGDHVEVHDKSIFQSVLNAKFIACARDDVPALVAEVERLREALQTIAEHNIFTTPQVDIKDFARQALDGEAHE
ncbi:hypothetical protein [Lysinibacillus sp. BSL11]